jgi:hypothetical protein
MSQRRFSVSFGAWCRLEAENFEDAIDKVIEALNLDYHQRGGKGVNFRGFVDFEVTDDDTDETYTW